MRIECNMCKEKRNVSRETYERMLSRHAILRGIQLGSTVGIVGLFDKRFLLPDTEQLKHKPKFKMTKKEKETLSKLEKETSIMKLLSDEEVEKHFLSVYKCRECKFERNKISNIIEELKSNFKPWKKETFSDETLK